MLLRRLAHKIAMHKNAPTSANMWELSLALYRINTDKMILSQNK